MPSILSVSRDSKHDFSKPPVESIELIAGLGIDGDTHAGVTVQHLYDKKHHPQNANLRQVHLMASELFDELSGRGFVVTPGDLGENVTTTGVDLITLPVGTRLHLGETAIVELTGLRSPCFKINKFQAGLMKAVIEKADDGSVIRKSGVMSIVVTGGVVRAEDAIRVELPAGDPVPLEVV